MHPATALFRLLHLAIGSVVLSLLVRTWVVVGLVEPVTVTGSSMAPTFVGPHIEAECDHCLQRVRFGADQVPRDDYLPCPYCDGGQVALSEAALRRGTPLWIDRATYAWRNPRRWEVIVFRSPAEDGQLCIKRVVGLPGERVQLAGGDVWIDGRRHSKSLREQRSVRQLLRRGADYVGAAGEIKSPSPCFTGGCPYDDDMIYNARLSRPLNVLPDFLFSARLTCSGEGRLLLRVEDGPVSYQIALIPETRTTRLSRQGRMIFERRLQADIPRRLATGEVLLEVSTFDRQLLIALDGEVELRHPLGDTQRPAQSTRALSTSNKKDRQGRIPFAVGSERLEVWLTEVALWRDIYYEPLPAGAPRTRPGGQAGRSRIWQLASDELFLLGDNAPVSADSRIWTNPGVPMGLLVGRPVALR